jgi:hypothetical protein
MAPSSSGSVSVTPRKFDPDSDTDTDPDDPIASSLEFLKEGAIRMRFKVVDFALKQHVCGVFLLVTLIDPLQRRLRCYGQVNKGLTHF